MPIDTARARKSLKDFDLKTLFIEELGWDHHTATLDVLVDGQSLTLNAIAEKRGMVAFVFNGRIPDYPTRRKIERQVAKSAHEHLIIFTDPRKTTQTWQWVKREAGKPTACREHAFHRDQPGDALIQKLQALAFGLEEEETLTIAHVAGRARAAFDVERVTKRFYERFKTEHAAFLSFIKGIPDDELHRWYASVMLNRLMFIYFIQKKDFLNSDNDYLRTKLAQTPSHGQDRFYRDFLCPLFFEGFAKKPAQRSATANKLLGNVPYLNGGIFQRHQIEQLHGKAIHIADAAFEQLFSFFDQYHWHLDERPLRADNEINPDVLGYIFEKYINQKQMGAYYTKEDITGYIGKYTILPFLFEAARAKCKIAFAPPPQPSPASGGGNGWGIWRLLHEDPNRYIYPAVRHGVEKPLPPEIAAGLDDVSKRTEWNKPASEEYALPTEIWREVIARRRRYEDVRAKLANGDIRDINDLITYNLDIHQFAQDVIENCEGPELLRAFWHGMESITVLDPTCGSGAFLFAVLNILEPLYEACLNRMEVFLDELELSGERHRPEKFSDFRKILDRVNQHPNLRYFILKSIILNNLYGVDIMEEAIEICKLRLFLKLVAQVERVEEIEPLPDIDFNILAGNTLVGYATYDEVKRAVTSQFDFENAMAKIEDKAALLQSAFEMFRRQQTELGGEVTAEDKQTLRDRLKSLEDELNRYLAQEYGVSPPSPSQGKASSYPSPSKGEGKGEGGPNRAQYEKWLASHKPFHWFIEFYGIMKRGGFDVIIGNPPYVEYSKVKDDYTVQGYQTESCGNLYAFVVERCFSIGGRKGWQSLIVPLSVMSTERMSPLQDLLLGQNRDVWFSAFDVYPCKLFEGAKQRLAIMLTSSHRERTFLLSTRYNRWRPEEREHLFECLALELTEYKQSLCVIPKLGCREARSILEKLTRHKPAPFSPTVTRPSFYVHRIPYNYVKAVDFVPYFWNEVDGRKKSEDYKPYCLADADDAKAALAMLNSNLFFLWWYTLYEGYHCGRHEICSFPFGLEKMSASFKRKLGHLADALMEDLMEHKNRKTCHYKNTGRVVYDELYPRFSKPLIDQIDSLLATHYGLQEDEKDFVINFDIKYRTADGEIGEPAGSAEPVEAVTYGNEQEVAELENVVKESNPKETEDANNR